MDIAEQTMTGQAQKTRLRQRLQIAAGYLFAAVCVVLLMHDIHPKRLAAEITIASWVFVAPAVAFDVLTYILQGWRWSLLIQPIGRISIFRATQAIYSGLFVNEIVPLRVGEGARAYLMSRWLGAPVRAVVPSMMVERLLDAICLLVGIGVVSTIVPLPRNLMRAGDALGAVVIAGTLVFVMLLVRKERAIESGQPDRSRAFPSRGISAAFFQLASGLRGIGESRRLVATLAISAGLLICQGFASWFMMLAFGFRLPITAGFVVLLIVRLGTAIPNAPANVGSFQFFAVLALGIYGVDKTTATAFSVVDFVALTVPLWALGLLAITKSGMTLQGLRSESSRL